MCVCVIYICVYIYIYIYIHKIIYMCVVLPSTGAVGEARAEAKAALLTGERLGSGRRVWGSGCMVWVSGLRV